MGASPGSFLSFYLQKFSTNHQMAFFLVLIFMPFLSSPQLAVSLTPTLVFPTNSSLYWTNSNSSTVETYSFDRGYLARVILSSRASRKMYGPSHTFAFGFYCNRRHYQSCLLAIMIIEMDRGVVQPCLSPALVWIANRNHLVKENAMLFFDPNQGLVLIDSDGFKVWSTNLSLFSASGMTLQGNGNLVLFNSNRTVIWYSLNYPTDTLVMGQVLRKNQNLTSSVSQSNTRAGKFYLSITNSSLTAFVNYKKPVAYTRFPKEYGNHGKLRYVRFTPTSVSYFYKKRGEKFHVDEPPSSNKAIQLLRLDADGGVRIHMWQAENGWKSLHYELGIDDSCRNPLVCGKYGLCTDGECSCPVAYDGTGYFTPLHHESPLQGCGYVDALKRKNTKYKHRLVNFGNLSYFSYFDPTAAITNLTDLEACKKGCANHSTCKAVFFRYGNNVSDGLCYLPVDILSIRAQPLQGVSYNSISFIKVPYIVTPQNYSTRFLSKSTIRNISVIIGILIAICALTRGFIFWRKKGSKCQDCFDQVLGAPTRFTYKELCSATGKFATKLGRGGFGTVYKGELKDGTLVAVKRLDSFEQRMKEFVAEMKTMGNIHHINLLKLIGFCAEEANRLLVYQFMSNGSLDKWIFDRNKTLNWETRRKIILDIAKGLAYLHEECSERIAHLDVKPHNILLDENFNAKISDFGLARFIDRKHSHVVTGMRGTFGYLAPEWQHSKITVKADIYSFGIVILETVSGRMVLDYSLDSSDVHLLSVLERMAKDGRIVEIVDKKIEDWERNEEDILKMVNIAVWCLNDEQTKRPSMSTVVKVLEGTMEFEQSVEFKFDNVLVLSGESTQNSCSS